MGHSLASPQQESKSSNPDISFFSAVKEGIH